MMSVSLTEVILARDTKSVGMNIIYYFLTIIHITVTYCHIRCKKMT